MLGEQTRLKVGNGDYSSSGDVSMVISQGQPDLNYNLRLSSVGREVSRMVFTSNDFLTLGRGSGPVHILSLRWMTGFKMESLLLFSHWPQQYKAHI